MNRDELRAKAQAFSMATPIGSKARLTEATTVNGKTVSTRKTFTIVSYSHGGFNGITATIRFADGSKAYGVSAARFRNA